MNVSPPKNTLLYTRLHKTDCIWLRIFLLITYIWGLKKKSDIQVGNNKLTTSKECGNLYSLSHIEILHIIYTRFNALHFSTRQNF